MPSFENRGKAARYYLESARTDGLGALLVRFENEQVWAFDINGEWTPVAILGGQELESPWKED